MRARVVSQHTEKVATVMEPTIVAMALSTAIVTAHYLRNCALNMQLLGNPTASHEIYQSFQELLEVFMQGGAGGIEDPQPFPFDDWPTA